MDKRQLFLDLIIRARSKKDIDKIFDYFNKKNIDLEKEIGEDYLRTAVRKYFTYPE
jgi:predicted metalloprotease with PDZ domain